VPFDLEETRMRIWPLIMPDRARGGGRTKHDVEVFEKPRPRLMKLLTPRLDVEKIQ